MDMPIILKAAYGRKYSTPELMAKDYMDGKDFKLLSGPYCSRRDFENENVSLSFGDGIYININERN